MKSHAPVRELFVQVFNIRWLLSVLWSLMFQRTRMKWHEEGGIKIVTSDFSTQNTL